MAQTGLAPRRAAWQLLEDITADITLTRQFRSELEMGQSIMDQIDDAIAVFANDGTMTFSNAAYHKLWKMDPDASFAKVSVMDASRIWQDTCAATPTWGQIRDFVAGSDSRDTWWSRVQLRSGMALLCKVSAIQNGATMVRFQDPDGQLPSAEQERFAVIDVAALAPPASPTGGASGSGDNPAAPKA